MASSALNDRNENKPNKRLNGQKDGIATYRTAGEYANAVNEWLWQCYYWQCFSASIPTLILQSWYQTQNNPNTPDFNRNFPNFVPNHNLSTNLQPINRSQQPANRQIPLQGQEFLIPSLWKRFAAETIDFFILLVLKIMVTYIAVDFFEIVNLDKYDLNLIRDEKMDIKAALEVTSEIVTLEVIHRFVVCLFEAVCVSHGTLAPGGATPGKSIMRLRVVSCSSVDQMDNNHVRVIPARDIGIGWAIIRAFIKNVFMAFLFPIFFPMFFFQYNRTAYDLICSCIVVEDLPIERHRQ